MKRAPLCFVAAGLMFLVPVVGCAAPVPVRGQGNYTLVFSDDFNGTTLNTAVWGLAPWVTSLQPELGMDVLTLRASAANLYKPAYLASTGPRSATEPNYPDAKTWQEGYFEAKVRYSDNPWAWPGVWLFGMAKTEAWPGADCNHLDAEWDLMENGVENIDGLHPASSWYFTVLHRNTSDGTSSGYCGVPDDFRMFSQDYTSTGVKMSDWHNWAGRWTANELCTYMDDVQMQCVQPYDSTAQAMHLVFTMQYLAQCAGCPARPSDLFMQVDWVHVWQKTG